MLGKESTKDALGEINSPGLDLVSVRVTVHWSDGARSRSLRLDTLAITRGSR